MQDEDAELERLFLSEARRRVAGMREALRDPDGRYALFRHAHSLKGLAGSFGHERMERLAQGIAERTRPGGAVEEGPVDGEVSELEAEVEGLLKRRQA